MFSLAQAVISKDHVYVSGNIGLVDFSSDLSNIKLADGGVRGQTVSLIGAVYHIDCLSIQHRSASGT